MAKVKIYSTRTCPYCKMLKSWLDEKKVTYEEILVDDNQAGMEEMTKASEGNLGVPFSVVTKDGGDEVKIVGFDKQKFQEVLKV